MAEGGNPTMIGDENPEDVTWLSPKVIMFKNKRISNEVNSNVYEGRQEYLGNFKEVAIKLIQHTESNMRRIEILASLNHPNIVQYYDVGEHRGAVHWIYIVMEPCSMNLEEYIKKNPADTTKANTFFKQLVAAVDYLHDNNIAHQDLSPANILISKCGGFIKVVDFSASKVLSDDKVITDTQGSVIDGFKAPEVYAADYQVLLISDIFSLGLVTAYLFSHGKHPFGDDPFTWVYNIRNRSNPNIAGTIPSELPKRAQLIRLIQLMLQHGSADRPNTKKIMADPFFTG